MVTVIRPSRARCVNETIPRHECAVLAFEEDRTLVASPLSSASGLEAVRFRSTAMQQSGSGRPASAVRGTVRFLRRYEHGRGQAPSFGGVAETFDRSEERRVGKE